MYLNAITPFAEQEFEATTLQQADALVGVTARALPAFALVLKLPLVRGLVIDFDTAAERALFGR